MSAITMANAQAMELVFALMDGLDKIAPSRLALIVALAMVLVTWMPLVFATLDTLVWIVQSLSARTTALESDLADKESASVLLDTLRMIAP